MFKKLFSSLTLILALAAPAFAANDSKPAVDPSFSKVENSVNEIFGKIGGKVKSVRLSPVKGLYEVVVEKEGRTGVVYLDEAGKHLLQGIIIDAKLLQPVFAHPQDMIQQKKPEILDVLKIPVDSAFIMGNPKGTKKLYVFTDPDCPYCHKMHVELKKLEKIAPDVVIYVVLFPLPMHPAAYDKSRAILETMSREIMDMAFEGKQIPKPVKESSKTAVDAVVRFAGENGIDGTPTLVLGDGRLVVGVKDAATLKSMLEQ